MRRICSHEAAGAPTHTAGRALLLALLSLLSGCWASAPPQLVPGDLVGCHPGAYSSLSELRCRSDADCVLCASPESRCGELHTRADLMRTNPPCPRVTDAACGGAAAHCCEGRCVVSAGPPPL